LKLRQAVPTSVLAPFAESIRELERARCGAEVFRLIDNERFTVENLPRPRGHGIHLLDSVDNRQTSAPKF
jgi:hypothetical protein